MPLVETKFKGYFIDSDTFKVFSDKRGTLKELKQSYVKDTRKQNPKKYLQVGIRGCTLLHRLIASTFIGDIENMTVNHKDGDTLNNSLDNLEIVSIEDNQKHAKEAGLIASGEKHGKALYSDELLTNALEEIKFGSSVNSTAKKYGITSSYLNKVKNGVYRAYLRSTVFHEKL